jgi:hypothetical protein
MGEAIMLSADFIGHLRVRREAHPLSRCLPEAAVNARILFRDGVLQALPSQHAQAA